MSDDTNTPEEKPFNIATVTMLRRLDAWEVVEAYDGQTNGQLVFGLDKLLEMRDTVQGRRPENQRVLFYLDNEIDNLQTELDRRTGAEIARRHRAEEERLGRA